VRKELREKPILHLYLELREDGYITPEEVSVSIHEQLTRLDAPYADLESFIGLRPLEVTLLPRNAFRGYMLRQQAAGADLAHLKPPRINPSDSIIDCLVNGSGKVPLTGEEESEREAVRSR